MCDKSLLATGNAAAIAIAILTLCVLPDAATAATDSYVSPTATGATAESLNIAAEVQQFRIAALTKIDNFLQHKLPENMQSQGEAIRAETLQQLDHCAQLATNKDEIWRFRQCAGEELGNSMKALALLVKEAYHDGGSKATHAFWLSFLLVVPFLLK